MPAPTLALVDPATNPYLSGRFAPVEHEIDAADLVVEGTIPVDIAGAFVRNGPNPHLPPLGSYTYPMEGDAMLHGVWLEAGRARYRNRFVRTKGFVAEETAGRALFGGLMSPAFVDPALLGPDPDPGWPFRLDPFINIVRHGGRYLALGEGVPPYEVTPDLETVGLHDYAGRLTPGMTAHPKIDPGTGEMVLFCYNVEEPFLTWSVVAADGTLRQPPTAVPGVDRSFMIHDFAMTPRFAVFVVGPAVLDMQAMMTGGQVLAWKPELGTRVALVARDGSGTQWFSADTFWAWHLANAYDDGDDVVVDFPYWSSPGFLAPPGTEQTGGFTRLTVGVASGALTLTPFDDAGCEFPRIDDRRTGARHRYVTVAGRSDRTGLTPGEHDVLLRYDVQTGARVSLDTGVAIGEVVFAPRTGATDELDGYYLTFGTSFADGRSALYVWDADLTPASTPRAKVLLPQRVPNGLHGNWFPAD